MTRPHPLDLNRTRNVAVVALTLALAAITVGLPAAAQDTDAPDLARFEGVAFPSKQVVLNAPIDGKLKTILFEEGDTVQQGDVLAQMDDAEQLVAVLAARLRSESDAEVRRAQFALDESVVLLERATETYERDAASEWEVRRAQLQRDQAEADLQIARDRSALEKVNLELEETRLKRLRVVAPFDGEVIEHSAEPGATLSNADPVLAVAALSPLEAHINLPVSIFAQLEIGRTYLLDAGDPINAPLPGKLKHIYRIIDTASETVRCVFTIDNPNAELIAGFPVRLQSLEPIE